MSFIRRLFSGRQPICLTMIVRDEEHVIARAIQSVRHIVDCFAIVDTGSTDRTEHVARAALEGVRGEYVYAPWVGYGPARTVALGVSNDVTDGQGYAMIVDADDIWTGDRPTLGDADAYAVWFERGAAKWSTTRFIRLGRGHKYVGVVHEQPAYADGRPLPGMRLDGLAVTSPSDGATSRDPEKYLNHARMIQRAMVDDPTNTRYAFYLAQSYRDHGDDARAALLYLARAAMGPGDYPEEVYIAYLEAGRALWRLGRIDEAKSALLRAHQVYPARREAMAELARLFAIRAATSPTVGTLFVEQAETLEAAE